MTRVRDVEIDAPGGTLPAFFARSFDFPNPTVLVVQDARGLDGRIQDVTLRLTSSHEWSAIAPDLYRGALPAEDAEAEKLATELDRAGAVEDLSAALRWLRRQGAEDVAVVGFGLGAGLALDLARAEDRLAGVVAFHPPDDSRPDETPGVLVNDDASEAAWERTIEFLSERFSE